MSIRSLNNVQLIGCLGQDAEARNAKGELVAVVVNLATTDSYQDASNQWVNETEWHRCVFYGKQAKALAQEHLKKGEFLFVQGSKKTRKWTDKNNQQRTAVEIICNRYMPIAKRQAVTQQPAAPQQQSAPGYQGSNSFDSDVPF